VLLDREEFVLSILAYRWTSQHPLKTRSIDQGRISFRGEPQRLENPIAGLDSEISVGKENDHTAESEWKSDQGQRGLRIQNVLRKKRRIHPKSRISASIGLTDEACVIQYNIPQ
jgi:hypothetical protein